MPVEFFSEIYSLKAVQLGRLKMTTMMMMKSMANITPLWWGMGGGSTSMTGAG